MERNRNIITCLENRLAWYKTSVLWGEGKIQRPTGFNFPTSTNGDYAPESVWEWRGIVREIQNTLNMLKDGQYN